MSNAGQSGSRRVKPQPPSTVVLVSVLDLLGGGYLGLACLIVSTYWWESPSHLEYAALVLGLGLVAAMPLTLCLSLRRGWRWAWVAQAVLLAVPILPCLTLLGETAGASLITLLPCGFLTLAWFSPDTRAWFYPPRRQRFGGRPDRSGTVIW